MLCRLGLAAVSEVKAAGLRGLRAGMRCSVRELHGLVGQISDQLAPIA